jgi:hypothetical protein
VSEQVNGSNAIAAQRQCRHDDMAFFVFVIVARDTLLKDASLLGM